MTDAELLERLQAANAYRIEQPLPAQVMPRNLALLTIGRRIGMETQRREDGPANGVGSAPSGRAPAMAEMPQRIGWRGPAIAAAVLVAVLVVGGILAVLALQDDTFDAAAAQGAVDDYFAAYNAGDHDGVMTLFADDAEYDWTYAGDAYGRAEWEIRTAWFLAQDAALTPAECITTSETEIAHTIECAYGTHFSTTVAVDALPVPTTATFVVTDAGITLFDEETEEPDYDFTNGRFIDWMETNHPDDAAAADFADFASVEEARRHGEIRAQYAAEWGEFLVENDCDWRDAACPAPAD